MVADGLLAELAIVPDECWLNRCWITIAVLLACQLGWGWLLLIWETEGMAGWQLIMPALGSSGISRDP